MNASWHFTRASYFFRLVILALFLQPSLLKPSDLSLSSPSSPVIHEIFVRGNKRITKDAIINRLPYKKGETLDERKSEIALYNINKLGYFSQIQLEREYRNDNTIDLYVLLVEKKLLDTIDFKGNKNISKRRLLEKLNAKHITSIDRNTVNLLIKQIKKIYGEDNYHKVEITPHIFRSTKKKDKIRLLFSIKEGPQSLVTHVSFKGNKKIPSRKLCNAVYTKESWLLNFMNEAGTYNPENLDIDKYRLEYFYRDQGYLTAAVINTDIAFKENDSAIHITFEVEEGPQYKVAHATALGDDIFTPEELQEAISVDIGRPYSQKAVLDSMQRLKNMWGSKGYIYADVYPQLKPNENEKTVDITFHVERGIKMYVNRINITGNESTRDKVIRREIDIEEGDLLTTDNLLRSKGRIEYLGYFEQDGVNWKIHRITQDLADLEINVKETKTGQMSASLTYGSDKNSPNRSLKGVISFNKRNFFGKGWDVGLTLQGNRHRMQRFQFDFFDPYFLDTDISGAFNFYIKQDEYDQWKTVTPRPVERITGGSTRFGFHIPQISDNLQFLVELGIESIDNNDPKVKASLAPERKLLLEPRVNRAFQKGTINWIAANVVKDSRNHRVYPCEGYRIACNTKFAFPFTNSTFSIAKGEVEASWYTALIGRNSLVLALHGRAGMIRSFSESKIIPYKELFHMGGQNTVRGFTWGGIGPSFLGEPLGGRNMVQFNTELIFPLIEDYSMKAHLFYDAGAGWDTPKESFSDPAKDLIRRDKFDLRHSIGFGINLLYPQPVKVDFGYKLDRHREEGESAHEWHLSMNMAW